jgi:Clostripain family
VKAGGTSQNQKCFCYGDYMKKIILKIIPLLLMFSSFSYAQNFDLNSITAKDMDFFSDKGFFDFVKPDPQPTTNETANKKEWTVMVYINGKNDLSKYGKKDVNEMETVGSTSKMNIVVELGTEDAKTKRFLVKKDKLPSVITSKTLETLETDDMGDWKHMADFALWSKKKFPAKRYMLIIWNHGDGWVTSKGISYDFKTNNHISTPELGQAMKEIGKVDILAMDACLMQMAEVAFEVKNYVDIVVASEETEPGDGYPYDTILKKMAKMTTKSNELIATNIVTQYEKYYSSNKKTTQSALKTSQLDSLVSLLNDWTQTAMALKDKLPLISAINNTDSYAIDEYKDLSHFIQLAGEKTKDEVLIEKSKKINEFIANDLIIAKTSLRKNANGLAIYMTKKGTFEKYAALKWSKATQWDEFLNSLKGLASSEGVAGTGCIKPDDNAPIEELLDYVDCLTNSMTSMN